MSQNIDQKELILRSAYECIAEKGYANSSLRVIATRAEVTLSQLHYYYGNKEDLFKAVISEMVEGYLKEIERLLASQDVESKQSLISLVRSVLEEAPEYFRVMFDLASLSMRNEEFKKIFSELFIRMEELIETYILENKPEWQDAEEFKRFNLSKILLAIVIGLTFQYTLDPERNSELLDAVDHMGTLIL